MTAPSDKDASVIFQYRISPVPCRYETGLEQLDFAAGQVAVMQQNLRDLQPLLVETSDKTEKLMIKIEQDTVVVEKQKEVRVNVDIVTRFLIQCVFLTSKKFLRL